MQTSNYSEELEKFKQKYDVDPVEWRPLSIYPHIVQRASNFGLGSMHIYLLQESHPPRSVMMISGMQFLDTFVDENLTDLGFQLVDEVKRDPKHTSCKDRRQYITQLYSHKTTGESVGRLNINLTKQEKNTLRKDAYKGKPVRRILSNLAQPIERKLLALQTKFYPEEIIYSKTSSEVLEGLYNNLLQELKERG